MKIRCLFFCFVCLALLLIGCGRGYTDPRERLEALLATRSVLPVGRFYDSRAMEWESEALPSIISQNLYKNQDGDSAFSLADGWALFLATGITGAEAAVFVADDRDARVQIGKICRERLSLLRSSFAGAGHEGAVWEEGEAIILLFLPPAG